MFNRIHQIIGENYFKISHNFQYVISTVCINFGAEMLARVLIDLPVKEKW